VCAPAAFHFGVKEHNNLDALLALLKPFGITVVHSGDNFAYKSRTAEDEAAARSQDAQKIERDRASLRTWCSLLARKGIRFSKTSVLEQPRL
jgi:IS1 family transposase